MMLKNRNRIIIAVFIIWAMLITCRLFYYTVYSREHYVEEGDRHAWRSGVIPAARGRILDRNGQVLAWTQRYYDLSVDVYPDLCRSNAQMVGELKKKIKGLVPDVRKEKYSRRNLTPSEMILLKDYIVKYQGVNIMPRLERIYVDYPEVRRMLGSVRVYEDKIYGIDGIEKQYDLQLRGNDGVYRVMLDRNREWIPGTWKLKAEMQPGEDVKLDYSLEEIIKMKKSRDEGKGI